MEELSAGEWAVLALLDEAPAHGWAAVRALAPDGDIGRVWSLPRALVYRAIEQLSEKGLIEEAPGKTAARGPRRTVLRTTRRGRSLVRRWLTQPVEHVRDVRWLLLMKLLFCERSDVDPRPLLEAQAELIAPIESGLAARVRSTKGSERMLATFRLENTRAVRRFVQRQLKG